LINAISDLTQPIDWEKKPALENGWVTQIYGECGSGKSTTLNLFMKIFNKNKLESEDKVKSTDLFDAAKSTSAVTTKPKTS